MHDLRGLAALQALDRHGTIAGAAVALGYTASAVSQQLAGLEREVGVSLVDRGPKSARLSVAGREFLAEASSVLDVLEMARARAAAAVGRLSGRIVVAAIPSVATRVAAALAQLRREEPLLDVTLVQSSAPHAQRDLVEGLLDIAVVDDWATRSSGADARIDATPCFTEPIMLVGHGRLLRQPQASRGESPRDPHRDPHREQHGDPVALARELLPRVPLLSATEGNYSREFVDAWLAHNGLSPRLRWEFDGLDTIAALVAQAHGVALLPADLLPADPLPGGTGHSDDANDESRGGLGDLIHDRCDDRCFAIPTGSHRTVRCLWMRGSQPSTAPVTRAAHLLSASLLEDR